MTEIEIERARRVYELQTRRTVADRVRALGNRVFVASRLAKMRRQAGASLWHSVQWALGLVNRDRKAVARRNAADLRDQVRRDARGRL